VQVFKPALHTNGVFVSFIVVFCFFYYR